MSAGYPVIGGEASTSSHPCDWRRGVSRGETVELQALALLDIGYGRLDADCRGTMIHCVDTNTSVHTQVFVVEGRFETNLTSEHGDFDGSSV